MQFSLHKFYISLGAAAGVLATALADGKVDGSEWISIIITSVGAYGVFIVPNKVLK
jgi:hypothetical protein